VVIPPVPDPVGLALWIDLEKEGMKLKSAEDAAHLVDQAAGKGVRRIILDIKKNDGSVVFKSRRAPRAELPFDYFQAFRTAADRRGIELVAHFEVLVEGDTRLEKGPAYDHPEWQTVVEVEGQGLMPQSQAAVKGPVLMASPVQSEVQMYEASVLADLLLELKPAAVLIDELRFFALASDYGDTARAQYEGWTTMTPGAWPRSVQDKANPRFKLWMTYRVGVIHEFLSRLKRAKDTVSPSTRLYLAVPGYYESSVELGMNWCSRFYKPRLWYADGPQFRRFALADLVDQLVVICHDSNPHLVRDLTQGSMRGTMNRLPLAVALSTGRFAGRPARFRECLQTIGAAGLSPVIRDIEALDKDGLWDILLEEAR
jgi:hypothetical protein